MTNTCRHCGAAVPTVAFRGAFTATVRPHAVYYAGEWLKLSPTQARVLCALAAADYVSIGELRALGIKSDKSLMVHVFHIRQVLPAGVTLENDFGRGYRLKLP